MTTVAPRRGPGAIEIAPAWTRSALRSWSEAASSDSYALTRALFRVCPAFGALRIHASSFLSRRACAASRASSRRNCFDFASSHAE